MVFLLSKLKTGKFYESKKLLSSLQYIMQEKKYSIVQVIDMLNIGGAERVLVTLSNILNAHGQEVTVLTTVRKGALAAQLDKDINQINLERKSKWNLNDMRRLVRILTQYDVVHVHSSYNLRYVFLASKIFGLKKKIFFHEHFGDIEINKEVKWHQRFIYPKTIMICVSRKLRDWAIAKAAVSEEKIFLLRNIVLKNKEENIFLKEKNDIIQLVMVANIRPSKNIGFAIELMAELMQTLSCHLTIIGQTPDDVHHEKIKMLIDGKKLAKNISIKTDVMNVQPLLKGFHLAIHTAKSESGPLVLIEYLAQGLPFITYNTGEVVEQITNDMPQLVMENFETIEWAERIKEILTLPQNKLHSQLTMLYERYFSAEKYYQDCISIYEKGLLL
jgi:glycosyltransferase involved in cell wall biosynthesis